VTWDHEAQHDHAAHQHLNVHAPRVLRESDSATRDLTSSMGERRSHFSGPSERDAVWNGGLEGHRMLAEPTV
jgi:hypothetical protein